LIIDVYSLWDVDWPLPHFWALLAGGAGIIALLFLDGEFSERQIIAYAAVTVVGCVAIYFAMPSATFDPKPVTVPVPAPRRLSSHEREELITRLSQFKGTKIAAGAPFGDDEAKQYRDDFVAALNEAGWEFDGHVGEAEMVPPVVGVIVRMNLDEALQGRVPPAEEALAATLVDLHIIQRTANGKLPITVASEAPKDRIWLFVGTRPKTD
jgi:hypothetical protein